MAELSSGFFIKSRFKLKELLLPASAVIISSNRLMPRNGDQHHPFRQSSDMYYLTGIREEACTLVIYPDGGSNSYSEVLFIPQRDKRSMLYDGNPITPKEAESISGVKNVRYNAEIKRDLLEILENCRYLYFGTPESDGRSVFPSNELEIRKIIGPQSSRLQEHDLAPLMTRIRMYKEPEEIEMIRKAISITGDAFIRLLQSLNPGMMEYEAAAILTCEFLSQGVREHAFDPIVASGTNALILHYIENRGVCNDGDLLLLDFGADWEYYAADISRTIPVNRRFSRRQRALYDANLRVMQKAIKLMKPGILLSEFNREVGALWEEEHVKLKLYEVADIKKHSKKFPLWQEYYWHGTSHSMGIDVHDRFDPAVPLKPGMVLSCEPGIYIREEGIGIRLENDILITENEPLNLSENIPIDPDAIEVIMNKS